MSHLRVPAVLLCATVAVLGFSTGGCVDTVGQARVEMTAAPAKVARRDGVSPRGATVALAAVDGAPQGMGEQFAAAFAQAAGARELTTVEANKADYVVRGYLTAFAAEPGVTRVSYVFDLFDKSRRRIQRLSDDVRLKGVAADPWSLADETALRALADRSATDLADALTNTPEAVAASAIASAAGSKPAAGETKISQSGTTSVARTAAAPTPGSQRLGLAATR